MQTVVQTLDQLEVLALDLWERVAHDLKSKPVVLALTGPLGAGKTAFTKLIGVHVGIRSDEITSPTFTLHTPHEGAWNSQPVILDHLDVWRIEEWGEIERLGLSEMLQPGHLVVVEWADKFKTHVENLTSRATVVWISFAYGEGEDERTVTID